MKFLQNAAVGGLAALLCFSGAAQAGLFTDADANWTEGEYVQPGPPKADSLRAFFVSSASPNEFLIDESSIAVGADGVVRYVLVIRSPSGVESVTFEGIRCANWGRRMYATGRTSGEWAATRNGDWEPIVDNAYNRPRAALAQDYFCDGEAPPRNREEVLRRLRSGGGALIGN